MADRPRMIEVPDLVDLAQGLRDAGLIQSRAESRLADFLALTLPSWRSRFPRRLGWTWADPALDVWEVFGAGNAAQQPAMERAARALHVRGFALVTLHDHGAGRVTTCECKAREL